MLKDITLKSTSSDEFIMFTADMNMELRTYHDMTDIFGTEYHEAELADVIVGAYTDKLIGVAYYKPTLVKGIKEFGIVVKEKYQGKGVGKKLLNEIERIANESGFDLIAKTIISNRSINKILIENDWKVIKRYYSDGYQYLKKCKNQN